MITPSQKVAMLLRASPLMLVLAVGSARASVQDRISESRVPLPASTERGFSGEIGYAFDTALNMTTARFKTSLARRNIFARIFQGTPTVHTLTAAYEIVGREPLKAPDSIRISLMSDEWSLSYSDNALAPRPDMVLELALGDSVVRFPMSIAQKTEVWWPHDGGSPSMRSTQVGVAAVNLNVPAPQVHIERTATVRLSTCGFLALLAAKDVHGTAAGLGFELDEDALAGLRQFAAEMTTPGGGGCRAR
jgi:hypothetical protein